MKNTKNYNLNKPDTTDAVYISDLNVNMDILDVEVEKKVNKITGKGLSSEDFTALEKGKLSVLSNPNLLIDGGFQVWEDGTEFVNIFQNYSATMWSVSYSNNKGSTNVLKINPKGGLRAITTKIASEIRYIVYNINYLSDCFDQQVTLSYKARKLTSTTRVVSAGYILPQSTEFEEYKITFNLSQSSVLQISCAFGLDNVGDGVEIEWIKLEKGKIATPFVKESYADVLRKTQYYFQKMPMAHMQFRAVNYGPSFFDFYFTFPKMRIAPSTNFGKIATIDKFFIAPLGGGRSISGFGGENLSMTEEMTRFRATKENHGLTDAVLVGSNLIEDVTLDARYY